MNWIKSWFRKEPAPIQIGNILFSHFGTVAIVDAHKCKKFDPDIFLQQVAREAYRTGHSKYKKAEHIRHWYDSAVGNRALEIYKIGRFKKIKKVVVGYSLMFLGSDEMKDIAIEMKDAFVANGNMVLLLPDFRLGEFENEDDRCFELNYYRSIFPDAMIITLEEND